MPQTTNRRYSPSFKIQVCTEIRSGLIGRREAQRIYGIGGGLIHNWLCKFDQGTLSPGLDPKRNVIGIMEDQIAELERLVGRLTAENQRLRHQVHAFTSSNDNEASRGKIPRSAVR